MRFKDFEGSPEQLSPDGQMVEMGTLQGLYFEKQDNDARRKVGVTIIIIGE